MQSKDAQTSSSEITDPRVLWWAQLRSVREASLFRRFSQNKPYPDDIVFVTFCKLS